MPVETPVSFVEMPQVGLAKSVSAGPTANASKPAVEWNRMTVTMKGDQLTVVINGKLVQDINLREKKPEKKKLVKSGKICIQDHGQPFTVRNLRVKRL